MIRCRRLSGPGQRSLDVAAVQDVALQLVPLKTSTPFQARSLRIRGRFRAIKVGAR
jgi:hypothetical protein